MAEVYLKKLDSLQDFEPWFHGLPLDIPAGRRVVIKPNLVFPAPGSSGIVSDVRMARMIINVLRKRGLSDITLAEGPGLGTDPQAAFERSGFAALSEELKVPLLDLNQAPRQPVNWYDGQLELPQILAGAYYINLAKIKTHVNTLVTLGLKNQKGLLSYADKKRFHKGGLHRPVAELYKTIKPDLTILDGFTAIEGNGPLFAGRKVNLKTVAISADGLAADATVCRLMGIDPLEVEHLKLAHQMGLGSLGPEIKGDSLQQCARRFKRPEMEMLKMLGLHNQRTALACSLCGGSAREGLVSSAKDPAKWARSLMPVLKQMVFGRVDFVYGHQAQIPRGSRKIIAVGECTKHLKERPGVIWVPGCPPSPELLAEAFSKL
jgi:uncharacterized protein (DUF362 family)